MENTWFASWFDSDYYHILYQHRDDQEAEFFIRNLLDYLQLPKGARLLDLACGKGRHSIYLNKQGYQVLGVDLAAESIAAAKAFESDSLQFAVHDMRETLNQGDFDAVLNLFTSFGYFETEAEHLQTLEKASDLIKAKDGLLVIDFMNAYKVIQNLVLREEKTVDGIDFHLRRRVENGYIVKDIRFSDQGEEYQFQERVRGFQLADFEGMFKQLGLELVDHFGNYALEEFIPETSDRLILIAKHA
jgi:SAM-dependent methyltransferase